jgi:signal transduction histidine kinase
VSPGQLSLTVEDDGVGLGTSTRRSGLGNLHQRAAGLGGGMTIGVPPGGGTRLCWSVPLDTRG